MRLTVVVDNLCCRSGLLAEWGYSAFLESGSKNVLLDTGGPGHVLAHNMNFLGIQTSSIQNIVLSHSHFDHISGLLDLVFKSREVKVYAGNGIERERRGDADAKRRNGGFDVRTLPDGKIIEDYEEIIPGVYAFIVPKAARSAQYVCCRGLWEIQDGEPVTDSFADDVSIAVKGDNGWSLLLGCAHAGLPNILQRASELFNIESFDTVVGGTHLCGVRGEEYPVWFERLKSFSVRRWRPNHCTGFKAASALAGYFDDVDWAGCGTVLEL